MGHLGVRVDDRRLSVDQKKALRWLREEVQGIGPRRVVRKGSGMSGFFKFVAVILALIGLFKLSQKVFGASFKNKELYIPKASKDLYIPRKGSLKW